MRTSRALVAICALTIVTACSGGDGPDTDEDLPPASADPCALPLEDRPVEIASSCIDETLVSPTGPPPAEGSAAYDALNFDPLPGELKTTGNDVDVNKTTDSFSVTVQAGKRLGVQGLCEGRTLVKVETVPDSGAAVEFSCGFQGLPSSLAIAETKAVTKDTVYQVKVSVPAPARWYLSFYQSAPGEQPPSQ